MHYGGHFPTITSTIAVMLSLGKCWLAYLLLFGSSVVSDSLQPLGLQHTRLACPSPSPGICTNPCPLSWWCHPTISFSVALFSSCLQSPSIMVFYSESALPIRWPKYWGFSFSISPSNEYSRLISFRMDWLDLLAVQGNLKNLFQHHSSKASIIWLSAFFLSKSLICTCLLEKS